MNEQTNKNRFTAKTEQSSATVKTLPKAFRDNQEDIFAFFVVFSILLHITGTGLFWLLTELNIISPMAWKPQWQEKKDIVFLITQNEGEPVNKNTNIRSDRNSRAGGIHDPNRPISTPQSSPAPSPKQAKAPAPKPVQPKAPKQPQNPIQQITKAISKPIKEAVKPQAPKAPVKPSRTPAPAARPAMKPSTSIPKPQRPKIAAAPTSPFKIEVPKSNAPVGRGFSAGTGTESGSRGASGGASNGSYTGKGSYSGMPAPQFSTSRVASSSGGGGGVGSKGSSGSGRGGYGTGNMGNPGPGNPSGAPGIDAIKAPQWGPYMRELEARMKRNWHPPKGNSSKRVVLIFKVSKRGELLSTRILKSSGSNESDQAAIKAVQMSAPFRPLPAEYKEPSVEIEFTFDYNVFGTSYR